MEWMYPPKHRILGWITKPSNFKLSRDVWRLDQIVGIGNQDIFVKGICSQSDQVTLDRFPTLMQSDIFNRDGNRLGLIADFVFEPKLGKILYYLVSRSNPKIPGTSRWRLQIDSIIDQQPGMVLCDLLNFDDLPIERSSLRQDFLIKSRKWRSQLDDLRYKASDRLEGWLEENPSSLENLSNSDVEDFNSYDDWVDDSSQYLTDDKFFDGNKKPIYKSINDSDPWI